FDRASVDITDSAAVDRAIGGFDPAVVLNAAAYNQVDVAESEPSAAFMVNALAVRNLAVACRNADAKLVHFSTDYVFDGRAGSADRRPGGTRRARDLPHRRRRSDFVVRLGGEDLRSRGPESFTEADQRTGVPDSRAEAEVFGAVERQDGGLGCGGYAFAGPR